MSKQQCSFLFLSLNTQFSKDTSRSDRYEIEFVQREERKSQESKESPKYKKGQEKKLSTLFSLYLRYFRDFESLAGLQIFVFDYVDDYVYSSGRLGPKPLTSLL
jgi:hypothetical protein